MRLYRRRNHDIPALNTASLPDLIFSILFFFMLVVHMRKATVHVKYQVPSATQLSRLDNKSLVQHIYRSSDGRNGQGYKPNTRCADE